MTHPNRAPSVQEDVGPFTFTITYCPKTGAPVAVFFVGRGKIGQDLDHTLYQMGVRMSKLMQHEGIPEQTVG